MGKVRRRYSNAAPLGVVGAAGAAASKGAAAAPAAASGAAPAAAALAESDAQRQKKIRSQAFAMLVALAVGFYSLQMYERQYGNPFGDDGWRAWVRNQLGGGVMGWLDWLAGIQTEPDAAPTYSDDDRDL